MTRRPLTAAGRLLRYAECVRAYRRERWEGGNRAADPPTVRYALVTRGWYLDDLGIATRHNSPHDDALLDFADEFKVDEVDFSDLVNEHVRRADVVCFARSRPFGRLLCWMLRA